jgi:hypothetical protein
LRPIFAEATVKRKQKNPRKNRSGRRYVANRNGNYSIENRKLERDENREEGKLRWLTQRGHRQKARADEEAPIATAWELREQRSELGNRNTISSSLDYDVENKLVTA